VVLTRGRLRATGDAVCTAPNPRRFTCWEDLEGAYATWMKDVAGRVLRDLIAALDAPPPPSPCMDPEAHARPACPDPSHHRRPRREVTRPDPVAVGAILAACLAERERVSISDLARAIQMRVPCSRATAFRAVEGAIAAKAVLVRLGYLTCGSGTEQRKTANLVNEPRGSGEGRFRGGCRATRPVGRAGARIAARGSAASSNIARNDQLLEQTLTRAIRHPARGDRLPRVDGEAERLARARPAAPSDRTEIPKPRAGQGR
jgi:hypothetical protein